MTIARPQAAVHASHCHRRPLIPLARAAFLAYDAPRCAGLVLWLKSGGRDSTPHSLVFPPSASHSTSSTFSPARFTRLPRTHADSLQTLTWNTLVQLTHKAQNRVLSLYSSGDKTLKKPLCLWVPSLDKTARAS
jgi:hypothetical protein